jgi:hypothetical protein
MHSQSQLDLLGAILAVVINLLVIAILAARLVERESRIEWWLGMTLQLALVPLLYLLVVGIAHRRPPLYLIQVGLMIVFLLVELVLDHILHSNFRQVRWMIICYAMLFFASTGGMIGVASRAGRGWLLAAVLSYLAMAAVTVIVRVRTGL